MIVVVRAQHPGTLGAPSGLVGGSIGAPPEERVWRGGGGGLWGPAQANPSTHATTLGRSIALDAHELGTYGIVSRGAGDFGEGAKTKETQHSAMA